MITTQNNPTVNSIIPSRSRVSIHHVPNPHHQHQLASVFRLLCLVSTRWESTFRQWRIRDINLSIQSDNEVQTIHQILCLPTK